ncbi:2TM domain-containing protein [Lutibacter sp. Hel_I_33_5]|uniref:2TM domain-containing protein n=1 Tax=Lutibacter sp. Hel_I_33_5 TaxID=1566289 RepID=UPI0011A93550|nr:2TM domain-containing protein [Lutibacter sp. Hel_I_33_5]TVZ55155.1 2TM domain-containing protein [Lutibacter sp. Hel_I_33_5]
MERDYTKEHQYIKAKKRVEKIKGFYWHAISYVMVNLFLSGIIVFGMMSDGNETFFEAVNNFGVYSTWVFWGIGLFFHWLGVFGSKAFFSNNWEERKIKEYLDNDKS